MQRTTLWLALPRETPYGRSPGHVAMNSLAWLPRRIWKDAATPPELAWRQFQAWAAAPSNRMIGETDHFADILGRFVLRPHVVGGVVHDARIAALCVAHGVDMLLTRGP